MTSKSLSPWHRTCLASEGHFWPRILPLHLVMSAMGDVICFTRRSKASDLKEQLIYWQTPPDATWPAMEERIEWLHQAMLQLKDITTGLQQHGISWKESDHIKLYLDAIKASSTPNPLLSLS